MNELFDMWYDTNPRIHSHLLLLPLSGQQQLSSYETSLSTSKLEKEASAQEAERLKEESIQSSQNMFLLNKTLTDCKTRIKALETALEHSQVPEWFNVVWLFDDSL